MARHGPSDRAIVVVFACDKCRSFTRLPAEPESLTVMVDCPPCGARTSTYRPEGPPSGYRQVSDHEIFRAMLRNDPDRMRADAVAAWEDSGIWQGEAPPISLEDWLATWGLK